jgi:hypothetical protein
MYNRGNDRGPRRGSGNIVRRGRGGTSSTGPFPTDENGEIIPGEYDLGPAGRVKIKKIERAKEYDVISLARAMNDDFGAKVKELFDPETRAVEEAMATGLYVSWRPIHKPYDVQDCQRVNSQSRCFCGHELQAHDKFTGHERVLKCHQAGCTCKGFQFIISRPEEAGEYWLRKRRDFDALAYRAKCRCKHTHEEHVNYPPPYRCHKPGCGCSCFHSAWVCAACDQYWHDHHTVFETEAERRREGRPVREDWYPFAELPDLKEIVLTGRDTGVETLIDALPEDKRKVALANRAAEMERQMGQASSQGAISPSSRYTPPP